MEHLKKKTRANQSFFMNEWRAEFCIFIVTIKVYLQYTIPSKTWLKYISKMNCVLSLFDTPSLPTARPGHRTLPRDFREEPDGPGTIPGRPPLTSQMSSGTVSSSIYKQQLSHRMIRQRSKRQSVARMGWDAVKSLKVMWEMYEKERLFWQISICQVVLW